ncbi:MAG: OmpH family outer membrane protein [Phycisphaerae bacterium]
MSPRAHLKAASVLLAVSVSCLSAASATPGPAAAKPASKPQPPADHSRGQQRPPTSIAVVDIAHVFNNYQRAKDLTKEMNELQKKLKAQHDEKVAEINGLKKEIEAAEGKPDEARKLKAKLQDKIIALKTWSETRGAAAVRRHQELTREMYDEILAATAKVARRRGFLLVLNAVPKPDPDAKPAALLSQIQHRSVVYADQRVHICPDVLAELNEAYSRKAKKPNLPPKAEEEF